VISENGVTKVFFGSNDGKFYGLNGVSGASLFSPVDTGAVIYSNPAYYNQTVFFASENMNGYAINTATGQIRWQKKLSGESNRGDHPVVLTASNTVLFYSVPRFGSTGMGLKDRWCPYGLTGGVAAVGCSEQALGDLLTNYQSKVVADPMSRSMYLFDISTGSEVTSFTAEGKSLTMIPLNLWYSNGQNFPLVLNSKDLLFGAFGGYIQLDTVSRTFTTALNYQPVRGDEYTGGSIADSWLYGGFLSNIARVKLTDKTRQQLHGCKDCGDPPPYKPFDQSPSTYHWNGYTGDGQTDFGSFFIVGSGGAYWFSNGWLYAF
jgi:outer membrane protein assembly factor BamB